MSGLCGRHDCRSVDCLAADCRTHGGATMNTGELTAINLYATPVGTPEGDVVCDSCNKGITDARRFRDDEDTDTIVHVYATCVYGTRRWALRWVSCIECGPLGDGEPEEAGEAFATATLTIDPSHERQLMIDDATITACALPGADTNQ